MVTAYFSLDDIHAVVALGEKLQKQFPGELVALEVMSTTELEIVLRHIPGSACPLANTGKWQLLVELTSSADAEALTAQLNACVEGALSEGLVLDAVVATSDKQREALAPPPQRDRSQQARRHGPHPRHRGAGLPDPRVRRAGGRDAAATRYPGVQIVIVGHIGDGNLHYIGMVSHEAWRAVEDKPGYQLGLAHDLYDIAAAMGGTFSAEHGIGALHIEEMGHYKDPVEIALMQQVKRVLDPERHHESRTSIAAAAAGFPCGY